MAIGDPYVTLEEIKNYYLTTANASKVGYDDGLIDAVASVSQEIETYTHRQFNRDEVATPRVYEPSTLRDTRVDDFWTTSGLIVETDPGGTGDFSQVWQASDYELFPLNGIESGQPGWPFNRLRSVGGFYFPMYGGEPWRRKAVVRVTAKWGWAAVPPPVKQACLIMGAETFRLKDTPFGVAGMGQFGQLRVRDNPMAAAKLARFVSQRVLMG